MASWTGTSLSYGRTRPPSTTGAWTGPPQALHVTPSAVSQRLKALERTVGAVLLQRSRPVRPTEPGEEVLRLARQLEALDPGHAS